MGKAIPLQRFEEDVKHLHAEVESLHNVVKENMKTPSRDFYKPWFSAFLIIMSLIAAGVLATAFFMSQAARDIAYIADVLETSELITIEN